MATQAEEKRNWFYGWSAEKCGIEIGDFHSLPVNVDAEVFPVVIICRSTFLADPFGVDVVVVVGPVEVGFRKFDQELCFVTGE